MTRSWPQEIPVWLPRLPQLKVLSLIAAGALFSGCAEKRARAYPWATAIQVHPVLVSVKSTAGQDMADLAPDLRLQLPPPPSVLEGERPAPLRPPVVSPPASSESGDRAPRTFLAPQLTPQAVAMAQEEINESLGIAERNLRAVHGHKLNAMQSDLLSKITSFIADSREAEAEGDWTRAGNLAKKAQVLSEELVSSF